MDIIFSCALGFSFTLARILGEVLVWHFRLFVRLVCCWLTLEGRSSGRVFRLYRDMAVMQKGFENRGSDSASDFPPPPILFFFIFIDNIM